ncbi:MAG TPA: DUF2304 domain-containing protein [Spirochaetota bacterium]|nr:DUF2304 domain-containing protein [Spirochaetota bacterium]
MFLNFTINRVQIIAIVGSLFFFFFILQLVRKRRIKEEYSLLWIFFSIIFILISVWKDGLEFIARFMGIAYSPMAFVLIIIMAVILILVQFSMVISKLTEKNKNLIQEVGILKQEIDELIKKNNLQK